MGGFFLLFPAFVLRPLNPYSMHKRTLFGKRFLLLKKKKSEPNLPLAPDPVQPISWI